MTYAGGSFVRSHPPHRLMQYAFAAQTNARLAASVSGFSRSFTTFSGGCSSSNRRNAFPTRQGILRPSAPPKRGSKGENPSGCNRGVYGLISHRDGLGLVPSAGACPASLQARRTDPAGEAPPSSLPRRATFHVKAAAHSDRRSLRLRSIVPPQSSQDFGGLSVLRERQPFAAVSGSLVFIHAGHHAPRLKAHRDYPPHLVRIPSRSAGCVAVAVEEQQ